jgi:hypothetical protein
MLRSRACWLSPFVICLLGACSVTVRPIFDHDAGDAAGSSRCNGYVGVDASPGVSQGLIAYYPCEQATGTTLPDQSGNDQNGTLVTKTAGSTPGYHFAAGKVGRALYLNSASEGYVVLPSGLLANACEATIATWVYLNNESSWQRLWAFSASSSAFTYLAASNDKTGPLRFRITTSGLGDDEQFVDGPSPLPTGTWTHVAVVLGPEGLIIYVNGEQAVASTHITLRPADLGKTVNNYIGRSNFGWDPYLDGNIDEFRIYDRALSHAEIQALASGS